METTERIEVDWREVARALSIDDDEEALVLLRAIREDVSVVAAKVRELDDVIRKLRTSGGLLGRLLGG